MRRILLVTDIFPPEIGGPATFIDQLAHKFSSLDYRVTVVCSSNSFLKNFDKQRPFIVRRVYGVFLIKQIKILFTIFREIIFHRTIFVNGLEYYVYYAAKVLRRPYILKVVGDIAWETARNVGLTTLNFDEFQGDTKEQNKISTILQRRSLFVNNAKLIIVPSEYLRKIVIGWGVKPARVRKVLNGVNIEEFSCFIPARRKNKILQAIFAGRLVNWKGIDVLLSAIVDIEKIHVTIIGDGPEFAHLLGIVKQLKLQDKVEFTGRLRREDVNRHLFKSQVLILPSLYEGLSHVLLEAMAMGVPCVASDCGGNSEVIKNYINGILIPAQNVKELRLALLKLIEDEDLRYRLACNARESIKHFDLAETTRQILGVILNE